MVVWVQYDTGSPRRVGTVGINAVETFTIAWRQSAQVRMLVRSDTGGGGRLSNAITVLPRDRLELLIQARGGLRLRPIGGS